MDQFINEACSAPQNIDFSRIVGQDIRRTHLFPNVHEGQASDVWLVEPYSSQPVIVRASRIQSVPDVEFWVGCESLFGIDPSQTRLPYIHQVLRPFCSIPIPEIIRSVFVGGRLFHVVERLHGTVVRRFANLPASAMESLGVDMASLHQQTRQTFGGLDERVTFPARSWTDRLIQTMHMLVTRYYADDVQICAHLNEMCKLARALPAVESFAPIMLDLDPTQFLAQDDAITGLVDLEVYAYGPPTFELCMMEYLVDPPHAAAFRFGYENVAPMPNLTPWRPLYRYLGLLLEVQGRIPYDVWMGQADRF